VRQGRVSEGEKRGRERAHQGERERRVRVERRASKRGARDGERGRRDGRGGVPEGDAERRNECRAQRCSGRSLQKDPPCPFSQAGSSNLGKRREGERESRRVGRDESSESRLPRDFHRCFSLETGETVQTDCTEGAKVRPAYHHFSRVRSPPRCRTARPPIQAADATGPCTQRVRQYFLRRSEDSAVPHESCHAATQYFSLLASRRFGSASAAAAFGCSCEAS
jgi:hypothetical protein